MKRRAEEINELMQKTLEEISNSREGVSGNVRTGCGETFGMQIITRAINELREDFPLVHCHLYSMDYSGVKEKLEKVTLDFGLLIQSLEPLHICKNFFIWKKNQKFSRAASILREKFLSFQVIKNSLCQINLCKTLSPNC